MLIPRIYEPSNDEILYHYCDAEVFLAICTYKKMRFGDVMSMNDFMEMHWGYSVWEDVASKLLDEFGKDFLDRIDDIIHEAGLHGLLIASCFSLDGDVLSQWRAYANDGQGFAIGFSAKDMVELSVRPLKVLYDEKKQIEELEAVVRAIYETEKSEKAHFGEGFQTICNTLSFDLAGFKNSAFAEEQEIRLVHLLDFQESNHFLKLVDSGGQAFDKDSDGEQVMFRMRENAPVAFIEQDFTNNGQINPIKEIVIGPKNFAIPSGISIFLETIGLGSVKIRKSTASYR